MFPGQEHATAAAAARPLRTFTYYRDRRSETGPCTVQAHYITYAPQHIVFMEDRPGTDRVVLAEHTDNVHQLTETA
jgi:hypothetical protein